MDPRTFDSFARSLAEPKTRRGLLGGIVAIAVGVRAAGQPGPASAQEECPLGQTRNRKDECRCPAGTDACPDGCYNLRRDPDHCGSCDQSCGDAGICVKGECRCAPDADICPSGCTDVGSDPNNCGSCENVCEPLDPCSVALCIDWVCRSESTCAPGTFCGFGGVSNQCGPATDECPGPGDGSSFQISCRNSVYSCTAEGTVLNSQCFDGFGTLVNTSININSCASQGFVITNCNGNLTCGNCP